MNGNQLFASVAFKIKQIGKAGIVSAEEPHSITRWHMTHKILWPELELHYLLLELPEAAQDMHDSLTAGFELFITVKTVHQIWQGTSSYAAQKENHSFKLDAKKFKLFMVVLFLSSYIPYPRCSMYWKMTEDSRNTTITSLFSRNRFVNVMRYLHLVDNNNLDASDEFAKIRPLFNLLNEKCLKKLIPERNKRIDKVPY